MSARLRAETDIQSYLGLRIVSSTAYPRTYRLAESVVTLTFSRRFGFMLEGWNRPLCRILHSDPKEAFKFLHTGLSYTPPKSPACQMIQPRLKPLTEQLWEMRASRGAGP